MPADTQDALIGRCYVIPHRRMLRIESKVSQGIYDATKLDALGNFIESRIVKAAELMAFPGFKTFEQAQARIATEFRASFEGQVMAAMGTNTR